MQSQEIMLLPKQLPKDAEILKLAAALKKAGSKGVVLTGLNDKNAQLITLEINRSLKSEIIDVEHSLNIRQGNDTAVAQLVSDLKAGKVAGVISYNVDPVYTLANGNEFAEGLKDKLSVAIAVENSETVAASNYVLPATHFLESLGRCFNFRRKLRVSTTYNSAIIQNTSTSRNFITVVWKYNFILRLFKIFLGKRNFRRFFLEYRIA